MQFKKNIKTVIINRAVPGSGKSSIAKCIKERFIKEGLSVEVFSTDDYFLTKDGRYVFDAMKLAEYHQKNLQLFSEALQNACNLVICDNTNLLPWDAELYTEQAREHKYKIILIDFPPRELEKHLEAQKVTAEKPDAHEVPEETLKEMITAYYKYWKYLQKNYKAVDGVDVKYDFNQETLQFEKTNELIKNYDYDKLITIQPDKYNQAKEELPQKILEEAFLMEGAGDFDENVAYWRELIGIDRQAASTYVQEHLLLEMTKRLSNKTEESCEVLISLLGLSPEVTISAAAALKTKELIVLTSKDDRARDNFNFICDFLINQGSLNYSDIRRETIDI